MIWVRLLAFVALCWLSLRSGLFLLDGYPLETKRDWVLTISAAAVLGLFVAFA